MSRCFGTEISNIEQQHAQISTQQQQLKKERSKKFQSLSLT